jgi:hypothetical protein
MEKVKMSELKSGDFFKLNKMSKGYVLIDTCLTNKAVYYLTDRFNSSGKHHSGFWSTDGDKEVFI